MRKIKWNWLWLWSICNKNNAVQSEIIALASVYYEVCVIGFILLTFKATQCSLFLNLWLPPHSMWTLSSPTRHGAHTFCIGSVESLPLDYQKKSQRCGRNLRKSFSETYRKRHLMYKRKMEASTGIRTRCFQNQQQLLPGKRETVLSVATEPMTDSRLC